MGQDAQLHHVSCTTARHLLHLFSMDSQAVCTFYQKIGACRHGDKCSRKHIRPTESKTVLLANLYTQSAEKNKVSPEAFDQFYADIYTHAAQSGEIEQMVVCENENFHLCGNVYVRYSDTQSADKAVAQLNQEWYGGRPVYCELSPVSNFAEANCRAYDNNQCSRGDHCNFMHTRRPSNELRAQLRQAQRKSLALAKIRTALGDPKWGQEWEAPTTRAYVREPKKEPEKEQEPSEPETEELSTTEAVARLFA